MVGNLTLRRFQISYHRQAANIVQSDYDLEDRPNNIQRLYRPNGLGNVGFASLSFGQRRFENRGSWHICPRLVSAV